MRLFTAIAAISYLGCVGCSSSTESKRLPDSDAAALLENRNWMDLWPASDTEQLHVYRFTPTMGGGVFQDRTLFAGHFELFTYRIGEGELHIEWPHTKQRETLTFTIDEVKGPEPFDLKLTLPDNLRGPSVYYGRRAETSASLAIEPRP
jgi:hypothetical protein